MEVKVFSLENYSFWLLVGIVNKCLETCQLIVIIKRLSKEGEGGENVPNGTSFGELVIFRFHWGELRHGF